MVRKTLQENECHNQPYSILKEILLVKYKALKNNAILEPFAACLYSEGKSGIQKVFDTVFLLSVLDEHSGENNAHRTLPHPFHTFFRKGTKPNCLEFKLDSDGVSTLGPKTQFEELRQHINSQKTVGAPKMTIIWDTCRRRIVFF
jgi:hypothetical protein